MRLFAAFLMVVSAAHGAALTGVVLDADSSRALARTVAVLAPAQGGTGFAAQTLRTESNGSFFFNVPPGAYLLTLDRDGFATYRYGAKCWNCPGAALLLNGDEHTAVEIRMRRLGAITGTVWDENQIGIPDIPIVVYTATRPLREAGKATTDDRGFFRVGELEPGAYVVRTMAEQTRDGMSYLATFYPEGTEMKLARTIGVELERTWSNADFPPVQGKLYRVQGKVAMPTPGIATFITLISDSGRREAPLDGAGNFSFDRVSPGSYELLSEGQRGGMTYAAWQPLVVEHDTEVNAQMAACCILNLELTPDQRRQMQSNTFKIAMRRRDPDKEGPEIAVKLRGMFTVAPGIWEIAVDAGEGSYVREITVAGRRAESRSKQSAEGWNVARIGGDSSSLKISTSPQAASISGRVMNNPNEPAPYAPVFLETLDLEPPDPPRVRSMRAGPDGAFQFHGLPPGKYRVISSFDLDPSDRAAMEVARPAELTLAEGANDAVDLALYHRP